MKMARDQIVRTSELCSALCKNSGPCPSSVCRKVRSNKIIRLLVATYDMEVPVFLTTSAAAITLVKCKLHAARGFCLSKQQFWREH